MSRLVDRIKVGDILGFRYRDSVDFNTIVDLGWNGEFIDQGTVYKVTHKFWEDDAKTSQVVTFDILDSDEGYSDYLNCKTLDELEKDTFGGFDIWEAPKQGDVLQIGMTDNGQSCYKPEGIPDYYSTANVFDVNLNTFSVTYGPDSAPEVAIYALPNWPEFKLFPGFPWNLRKTKEQENILYVQEIPTSDDGDLPPQSMIEKLKQDGHYHVMNRVVRQKFKSGFIPWGTILICEEQFYNLVWKLVEVKSPVGI